GIRDATVTGVQTCALPIWKRVLFAQNLYNIDQMADIVDVIKDTKVLHTESILGWCRLPQFLNFGLTLHGRVGRQCPLDLIEYGQIGRASCRESVIVLLEGG